MRVCTTGCAPQQHRLPLRHTDRLRPTKGACPDSPKLDGRAAIAVQQHDRFQLSHVWNFYPGPTFSAWLGTERGKHHARYDSDNHINLVARRRVADMAVFDWLGLLPRRRARPGPDHRRHLGPRRKNLTTVPRGGT